MLISVGPPFSPGAAVILFWRSYDVRRFLASAKKTQNLMLTKENFWEKKILQVSINCQLDLCLGIFYS